MIKEVPSQFKSDKSDLTVGVFAHEKHASFVLSWAKYHNLEIIEKENYINIVIPNEFNLYDKFNSFPPFEYVDGFSPNLNKHLHVGHLSNFIIANSFQKMGIGKNFIAILGDTLKENNVTKNDALTNYKLLCNNFGYNVSNIFFASEQILLKSDMLLDGESDYKDTKIFDVENQKIVGIKSDGTTSYFYQDVALAQKLSAPTLYLTGFEQEQHFVALKHLFPHIKHLSLGLVMLNGKKMSSSEGNVIMLNDVLELVKNQFDGNEAVAWNVLCGFILKSSPEKVKKIDMAQINNPKMSGGLYLSYTIAKLKSAGVIINIEGKNTFTNNTLNLNYLNAKFNLQPNILLQAILNHAKTISQLYVNLQIKDNLNNKKLFTILAEDLLFGMNLLGMYDVDHV
jgi:hypothetical protein